ncbi:MAG: phosphonate ABC transporter, permease protein PhnE [Acidimicrobiia bacterium]|nr:phosphonate ABC transporter, permease protein PhnE [Acidimicrobiia bacterium]
MAQRPLAPTQSRQFTRPILAAIGVAAVASVAFSIPLLWGALIGLALFAGLALADISRATIDAIVLASVGAAAAWWFDSVLDGRSAAIELLISLRAGLGWLVVGATVGAILVLRRPTVNPVAVPVTAVSAYLATALMSASGASVGVLADLEARQLREGILQVLGAPFHLVIGLSVVAVALAIVFGYLAQSAAVPGVVGSALFTLVAYNLVGFSVAEIVAETSRVGDLAREFWPPQWTWPKTIGSEPTNVIIEPMIETLQIAVIGATVGCLLAIPLAFFASRPTTPTEPTYVAARWILSVLRTIPDLFWAALFASAVGFGALAGALAMIMFSLVIMAKLFSETIDSIDAGPLEAARTSGARYTQVIQYGAFPQVLPTYVAYALYIFELNIRASVVIGVVGAGGIGRLLDEQRTFFQWDRVMAIVIVIFAAVIVIELFSIWVRRRLL